MLEAGARRVVAQFHELLATMDNLWGEQVDSNGEALAADFPELA